MMARDTRNSEEKPDARELASRLREYSDYANIASLGPNNFEQAADLLESLAAENEQQRETISDLQVSVHNMREAAIYNNNVAIGRQNELTALRERLEAAER